MTPSSAGPPVRVVDAQAPVAGGTFGPPPDMSPAPVTHVPGQRADVGPEDAVRPAAGKLSVSVAATSTTEANGRGRKVSCSVALAVAGAFAAVSVGSVFMFGMLGGEDDTDSAGSDGVGAKPTASLSPGDSEGDVPGKYLGTWEGDGYALGGNLPAGTFRVTLEQADVGEELGTFRSVDLLGGTCDDKLVLKDVTDGRILATSIAEKDNPKTCTKNTHEVTLTPVGAELQYESNNADAGDPTARLAKVE